MCENANSCMLRGHQLKQLQAGHTQPPLVLSGMNTGHMHRYIAHIETQKNTFRHTWVNTHTHTRTHMGINGTYGHANTHTQMYKHTQAHTFRYTNTLGYTDTQTYINTYTDTLKYI